MLNEIRPAGWGWISVGGWESDVNRRFGLVERAEVLVWTLDPVSMTGRDQYGHTIALRPFMGVMGMPPNEPGIHSTMPPRFCGGNIDCKELIAGTTLYLPIPVSEALFSVGDGHGVQGDGEVCGVAWREDQDTCKFCHKGTHAQIPVIMINNAALANTVWTASSPKNQSTIR